MCQFFSYRCGLHKNSRLFVESSSYNSDILHATLHTEASEEKVFATELHEVIVELVTARGNSILIICLP